MTVVAGRVTFDSVEHSRNGLLSVVSGRGGAFFLTSLFVELDKN